MVMLDKDLATVCDGVLIGRKTYGNTIKCACMQFVRCNSLALNFTRLLLLYLLHFPRPECDKGCSSP